MTLDHETGVALELGSPGDRASFLDDVARRFSRRLERRLRRSGLGAEDAADVTQEAFVRLCGYAGWREIVSSEGFLWRIARNLLRDRSRAPRLPLVETALPDELPSQAASAEETVASREQLATLQKALAELPPVCQAVFVAHRFDEKSYRQIATEFGISVSMVEKHMMRALAQFRERLERTGTPGAGAAVPMDRAP